MAATYALMLANDVYIPQGEPAPVSSVQRALALRLADEAVRQTIWFSVFLALTVIAICGLTFRARRASIARSVVTAAVCTIAWVIWWCHTADIGPLSAWSDDAFLRALFARMLWTAFAVQLLISTALVMILSILDL